MKRLLLLLTLLFSLSTINLQAADDISYECHPYYDNEGHFDEQKFQDALILDIEVKASNETSEESSIWVIFLLGIGGGLIALLTPCVFPMIPLTVSYFTKGTGNKKQGIFQALLYGFFIFLIYTLVSAPFHLLNLAHDV